MNEKEREWHLENLIKVLHRCKGDQFKQNDYHINWDETFNLVNYIYWFDPEMKKNRLIYNAKLEACEIHLPLVLEIFRQLNIWKNVRTADDF